MAVEKRRGCGYRKVGGIYLAGDYGGVPCHRLPIATDICPVCKSGIKQTRGLTWIDPVGFLGQACDYMSTGRLGAPYTEPDRARRLDALAHCTKCPACEISLFRGEEVGLTWIGEKYYATTASFMNEAADQGFSKRLPAIPKGFKIGKHWIFFAHPKAIVSRAPEYDPPRPGIFFVWKPERIEIIVTQTQSEDADFMKPLAEKGLTPVIVPDDDPDHQ